MNHLSINNQLPTPEPAETGPDEQMRPAARKEPNELTGHPDLLKNPSVDRTGDGQQWQRTVGLVVGVGTQAVFALTVVYLFSFLRFGAFRDSSHWVLTDALLALQFAIPHSILLHPFTRNRLRKWISPEFYGAFFCLATCASLMLMFGFWKSTPHLIWDLSGLPANLMLAAFLLSWISLLYSISLTGLGYQTGWTQWMHWWNGTRQPRRDFVPTSLYLILRHPVYLSFLGLIWFTPRMSFDHALLTGTWTIYIFVGSVLKDRRLEFYLGRSYQTYCEDVPGYPFFPLAALGRRQTAANTMPASNSLTNPSCRILSFAEACSDSENASQAGNAETEDQIGNDEAIAWRRAS
ncbi:MAG: hypothetical protein KDA91_10105 [Planctomycetaceae bacterium]|nr:hypothetical protein [Planctomycetaceae bacterium]